MKSLKKLKAKAVKNIQTVKGGNNSDPCSTGDDWTGIDCNSNGAFQLP